MTDEFKRRLIAAGEKLRAKGWPSASIELGATYSGIFDRPPIPAWDPMIIFSASIRSNSPHNYVKDWTFKTMEEAIAGLENAAENMPVFKDEERRKKDAFEKLSADERRLLGVYRS